MKLTQFKWLAAMLLFVTAMVMPSSTWAQSTITPKKPSTGDGSVNSPYQIGTAAELYWFAALVNGDQSVCTGDVIQNTSANAVLTADISNNTYETWTPIGNDQNPYKGTFDGQGHTIIGLDFNDRNAENVGLFGKNSGTIKNVGVVNSYFCGDTNVGGVCGFNSGTITGCYNTSNNNTTGEVSGSSSVGGVCGYNYGRIINCYNTGAVSGSSSVGGVCGANGGTITGCYNTGAVSGNGNESGTDIMVGGVCGLNYEGTITGCYNTGAVSGNGLNVGGVCGNNRGGTITGCYNTGKVSGSTSQFGGVCGFNESGTITGCYTNNGGVCDNDQGTITDCGVKTDHDFTDGTVCSLLNTALKIAKASVRFYQVTNNYPKLFMNVPTHIEGVYQISNKEELYAFALLVNNNVETSANAVLTKDIIVNTGVLKSDGTLADNYKDFITWTPIGFNYQNYTGTFDGNGYTVSGLYFNDSSKEKVGLFGYVDSGGKISNVGVLDSYFLFRMFGGGVCGRNDGEISNCYNSSTVVETSSYGYAGGVCGYNYGGKVLNSYNNGIISGSTNTGGVCGYNQSNGEITNCYNSGTVSGKGETNQIAGVCGYNDINCTISGCYNTGTVSGQNSGGVCGDNYGTVKNCYNTGTVSGQNVCGGVCGNNNTSGTITSCYNRGVVNGTGGQVGGICGNIGGSSSTTNCYYDIDIYSGNAIGVHNSGTVDNVMGKTTKQFNSGEVAYLLNGSSPYGEWGQKIGTDGYPVPGSAYKVLRAAQDGQEGTNYWATFSNRNSNAELMASTGEITVYNATVSGGTLTLTKRSNNKVALDEGVLLKANCEYVNAMNISDKVSAAATGENHLVATPTTAKTITAETDYTLYRLTYNKTETKEGLGFYLGIVGESKDGSQLKATPGKAYLNVSTEAATTTANAAPARGFVFPGDDETTGIGEIVIEGDAGISGSTNANDRIYNLQGQQVTAPMKGLYIKNNKKVIIK